MLLTILHSLLFGALLQQAPHESPSAATLVKQLSGVWKAEEDRTPRATDLDVRVFGPGAFDIRNVTLMIRPSGEGTLNISTAVVGRNGRRYAPSVLEAKLTIGDPVTSSLDHLSPTVTVVGAEERYLDGSHERWTIDGARASITVIDPTATEIEFRYDTKDGRGSFGLAMKRQRDLTPRGNPRSTRQSPRS
jgi:hypothetical protein